MRSLPVPPYLLPPEGAIVDRPWVDADGRELPDRLEHWDPFAEIEMLRTVDIDLDAVRRACRLNVDAAFALTASWYSSRTRLSGVGISSELGRLRGRVRVPVSVIVPGPDAGGRLDLRTTLVLRYPGSNPTPISPRREGAILWYDTRSLALEGGAARFPVTPLNFAEAAGLPNDAWWKLEWDPEALDAPVLAELRLLVNSDDDALLSALRSGAADAKSTVIRTFIMFDVARALVHGALANDRFVEDPEAFDEGTIGRMLFELISMYWPAVPIKMLAVRRREDPARLDAELQAHQRLFR